MVVRRAVEDVVTGMQRRVDVIARNAAARVGLQHADAEDLSQSLMHYIIRYALAQYRRSRGPLSGFLYFVLTRRAKQEAAKIARRNYGHVTNCDISVPDSHDIETVRLHRIAEGVTDDPHAWLEQNEADFLQQMIDQPDVSIAERARREGVNVHQLYQASRRTRDQIRALAAN